MSGADNISDRSMHGDRTSHRVLHLCAYYKGSAVYRNLFEALSRSASLPKQAVIVASRGGGEGLVAGKGYSLHLVHCLGAATRLSMAYKQYRMRKMLENLAREQLDIDDFSMVHAHTLYADGILAHHMFRKYRTPFVVTVRTTDMGIFNRFYRHWASRIHSVLEDARKIVFPSRALQRQFLKKYPSLKCKCVFVPNGIDDFWIDNARLVKSNPGRNGCHALYVGGVNRNKNLSRAIHAFYEASASDSSTFTILGGTREDYVRIYRELAPKVSRMVRFLGRVPDRERIRRSFEEADIFVMPSHLETFGLVYLEAISQCTPVVYTHNQGIDGLFPEGSVGCSCRARDVHSIEAAISRTLVTYPNGLDFSCQGVNPVQEFSWDRIARSMIRKVYE